MSFSSILIFVGILCSFKLVCLLFFEKSENIIKIADLSENLSFNDDN